MNHVSDTTMSMGIRFSYKDYSFIGEIFLDIFFRGKSNNFHIGYLKPILATIDGKIPELISAQLTTGIEIDLLSSLFL